VTKVDNGHDWTKNLRITELGNHAITNVSETSLLTSLNRTNKRVIKETTKNYLQYRENLTKKVESSQVYTPVNAPFVAPYLSRFHMFVKIQILLKEERWCDTSDFQRDRSTYCCSLWLSLTF